QDGQTSLSLKLRLPNRVQPEVMLPPGRYGRYTNKIHYFKKHVVEEVCKRKFALDFMEPVDTEALQVPSYYSVIDHPMDLITIIKRLDNNYYWSVEEAILDFRLIMRNCFTFNPPGDVVFRKGQMLEKFFQKRMRNMPEGPEILWSEDSDTQVVTKPRVSSKVVAAPAETERFCREQLKKLKEFTNQADTTARNFFNSKWDSLQKKLDKHYFKTVEEFRSHVDGIFKKYHDPAKMIYEKAFDQPGGWNSLAQGGGIPGLTESDLIEVLKTAKLVEGGLQQCLQPQCLWEPEKARSLVETLCESLAKIKDKMEAAKPAKAVPDSLNSSIQVEEIVERVVVPALDLLSATELKSLLVVEGDDSSDDEIENPPELVSDVERRTIQKLFAKLPSPAMREIVHLIHQIEGLTSENGELSFDVKEFAPDTLALMKRAVAKAMRAHSKLNLRDMASSEKGELERNLQTQLVGISKLLNKSRRRNAAPVTSQNLKKQPNVVRKRERAPPRPKPKQPQVNIFYGTGEARNLSDTSEDSSGPSSPQRPSQPLPLLPRRPDGVPPQTIVNKNVRMSSSSSPDSKKGSQSSSGSSSSSGSGSGSSSRSSSDSRSSSSSSSGSSSSTSDGKGGR
ncbi:hypothetical protein KR074_003597, partial [Drosophila pseudoananassae]